MLSGPAVLLTSRLLSRFSTIEVLTSIWLICFWMLCFKRGMGTLSGLFLKTDAKCSFRRLAILWAPVTLITGALHLS